MNRDYSTLLPQTLDKLFPEAALRRKVVGILEAYGREEFHREVERVHLGILRLSGTNLEMIEQHTNLACSDFRDLLIAAEYPLTFSKNALKEKDPAKYAKLEQKEREQYDQWLAKVLAA
jgi:hypothetical protein